MTHDHTIPLSGLPHAHDGLAAHQHMGGVMTDEQGYNGWKNYETWVMALWIDNEESTYNYSRDLAREALEAHETRTGYGATAAGSLSHYLKDWIEESAPELEASVWSDLLSAAFGEIDWYEIAENYLEEVMQEA